MKSTEKQEDNAYGSTGKLKNKMADEALNSIMNPQNPVATIRNLTGIGNKEFIQAFLDKVNMDVSGGELIQAAIHFGQNTMLKYYIEKGAKVDMPPDTVSKLYTDHANNSEYRKAPFIIQAACQGSKECFQTLLTTGCKLTEIGFIGLSKKRKNQVISNCIGAASFNGSPDILKYLLTKQALVDINYAAKEQQDFNAKGNFQKEYQGYTPLMLAVARGGQNLECVKLLLQNKAQATTLDFQGNTILHIAVQNGNTDALEFLIKNVPNLDLTHRNAQGDTAYSIASESKLEKALKLLDWYQLHFGDTSKDQTQQLLNELLEEEQSIEQKKQKKKDKKKRQKIRQLAEKEGVSYEEMERKFEEDKAQKELLDKQQRKEEEERRRQEEEEELRVRQEQLDRIRRANEEDEKRKIKQVRFERQDEGATKAVVKQQPEEPVTHFAHLKIKKPELQEVQEVVVKPRQPVKEEEKPVVSKPLPKQEDELQLNRKQRKLQQRVRDYENRKKQQEAFLGATGNADLDQEVFEDPEQDTPKDLKSAGHSHNIKDKAMMIGGQLIILDEEMKLQSVVGDKAKRRLKKKLQKIKEEEEEQQRQVQEKIKQKLAEEKRKEEEELRRQQEIEAQKNIRYEPVREKPQPRYRVKQVKEERASSPKPEPQVMMYRPKAKLDNYMEGKLQDQPTKESDNQTELRTIESEPALLKNEQDEKQLHHDHRNLQSEPPHHDNHRHHAIDVHVPQIQNEEHKKHHHHHHQVEISEPGTVEKEKGFKTPPSSPLTKQFEHTNIAHMPLLTQGFTLFPTAQSNQANDMIHQHLQQLQQIILGKEQEIAFLINKCSQLEHELAHTKVLKPAHSPVQGEEAKELRKEVQHSNEQLMKEKALNKGQVLDLEKQLSEEQAKRKMLEDKLFNITMQKHHQPQVGSHEKELLDLANEELRQKDRINREQHRKIETYEGHNLDKKSAQELQNARIKITEALKAINQVIDQQPPKK